MGIKKIKLIDNNELDSIKAKEYIKSIMNNYEMHESENEPDLVIAIGGDGAFIKALKNTNFDTKPLYVGINTGHLGFLQEIQIQEIDKLFQTICENDYKIETLSIEKIEIINNKKIITFFALNELTLRETDFKTLKFDVLINDKYFERFAGDGITISTPTGSTAYNLSSGGSIIYPSLKTLQLLPLSPLPISKSFSCLRNSVIVPENMTISLIPEDYYKKKIRLIIDGQNLKFNSVEKINITTNTEGINVLRFNHYDFWERINDKFLNFN